MQDDQTLKDAKLYPPGHPRSTDKEGSVIFKMAAQLKPPVSLLIRRHGGDVRWQRSAGDGRVGRMLLSALYWTTIVCETSYVSVAANIACGETAKENRS